ASSAADESVEKLIVVPGWDPSYAIFILSRAPFSEAAPRICKVIGWALCVATLVVGDVPAVGPAVVVATLVHAEITAAETNRTTRKLPNLTNAAPSAPEPRRRRWSP